MNNRSVAEMSHFKVNSQTYKNFPIQTADVAFNTNLFRSPKENCPKIGQFVL